MRRQLGLELAASNWISDTWVISKSDGFSGRHVEVMDKTLCKRSVASWFLQSYLGRIIIALVLILIVQAAYLWLTVVAPLLREQRIARRIESLGGFVNSVYDGLSPTPQSVDGGIFLPDSISMISLRNKVVPSDLFSDIERLPNLTHLDLHDCIGVTDGGILHLKGLTGIEFLDISGSRVTDEGLEFLESVACLRDLNVSRSQVTVSGLEQFGGLSGLTSLLIDGPQATDRMLELVSRRTKLACLFASNAQFTDAGLKHLNQMTSLTTLIIRNAQITDEGLENLEGMTSLRVLVLFNTSVTDSGLDRIKGLTSLILLQLEDTRTTPGGRSMLRKALPNCKIEPDP